MSSENASDQAACAESCRRAIETTRGQVERLEEVVREARRGGGNHVVRTEIRTHADADELRFVVIVTCPTVNEESLAAVIWAQMAEAFRRIGLNLTGAEKVEVGS